MRHEVPISIGDPFLVIIDGSRTWISCSSLEAERVAACRPDAELLDFDQLGFHELLESGLSRDQIELELASRAVARTGVRDATVEFEFPLGLAERLRADGLPRWSTMRRSSCAGGSSPAAELAGIRRAQRAAEAAMAAAAALLGGAGGAGDRLTLDGEPLTAERVRARDARRLLAPRGAAGPRGDRRLGLAGVRPRAGERPAARRDCRSRSTCGPRTTPRVLGRHDADVRRRRRAVRRGAPSGAARARGAGGRPGRGAPRDHRARAARRMLRDLRARGLSHAAHGPGRGSQRGLSVLARPRRRASRCTRARAWARPAATPLVAGDVLAVEPGLWQRDVGGVRFEDLLLITEDGCERADRVSLSAASGMSVRSSSTLDNRAYVKRKPSRG